MSLGKTPCRRVFGIGAAILALLLAHGLQAQTCEGPVDAASTDSLGFLGECVSPTECPASVEPEDLCASNWWWAAFRARLSCETNGEACASGSCGLDPLSLPVFSSGDCPYECFSLPTPAFPDALHCKAPYEYDRYDCRCSEEPLPVPIGGCALPLSPNLCIETSSAICQASGFDYFGDGVDCDGNVTPLPIPLSSRWTLAALAAALLSAGYLVFRRA